MMGAPSVRLTFYGAAETVTGSKFLVEAGKRKVLVDGGLFQGKRELRQRNWSAPVFEPRDLDAIVLTHAHIDHTGYLPLLVKRGFRGPIYCTPPTRKLLHLLLIDSARLQEEEARYANKHKTSRHDPAEPLYNRRDAKLTLKQLKTFERDIDVELFSKISVKASCAGHILGSCSLALTLFDKMITFSGDIGQYDVPILPDPQGADLGDLVLCESTYGNRSHKKGNTKEELGAMIRQAAEKKGPIIIPAFAVGRTQLLLYYLAELEREGKIPELPVAVDSPMAVDATKIYRDYRHDFDADAGEIIAEGGTVLKTAKTGFCRSSRESKALNSLRGSRIIISASGMVTGGRILHHMKRWLPQDETTVIFVGYQAKGTRGDTIQSGEKTVKIFGEHVPIEAEIRTISGLSAHGDSRELIKWLKSCQGSPKLLKVIHGEADASYEFAGKIRDELSWEASVARYGETVEI